ncbi:GNAT family N-acetyltransferase [Geobacter argillaceus]|uniref:Ribosomal protein S18 acetylase RimI-like enzyme n=1 Tax=Geobacter argillaceus TaxID=345631 RepID=A0A562V093_9BACT|nr:GNAT family N-acetyltransferase [Geobacter argillaceus]TWJ11203.1 ribosomal protein S18 acetylase RimI-like enzyme [Geobacter argillaceus]
MKEPIFIRNAVASDFDAVVSLDLQGSDEEKPAYWSSVFEHYINGHNDRCFLVAEFNKAVVGFIIGEVRAWEFGSPPCGWVFAAAVSPHVRQMRIGQQLFEEISKRLKLAGVTTVRTMADRDNNLLLSFFRSMGLRTGRYIELEKALD